MYNEIVLVSRRFILVNYNYPHVDDYDYDVDEIYAENGDREDKKYAQSMF